MATDNETTAETTTSEGTDGFPKAYIRLRTVLDALEIKALRYVLKGENVATRKELAVKIEALLMHCIRQIDDQHELGGCDPGFHMCCGVCVPYDCPDC
ncbi:MAG: hypothetical protein M3367_03580 [Acidobacteriota bacterium]|nr:hypothetical protein [Acidobacteriota bacterium]